MLERLVWALATGVLFLGLLLLLFWRHDTIQGERERAVLWKLCESLREVETRQVGVEKIDCEAMGLTPSLIDPVLE